MIKATASQFKTNFGKYLALAKQDDIHITKNGRSVAVLSAPKEEHSWVDEISGIVSPAGKDTKSIKAERLVKKYASLD